MSRLLLDTSAYSAFMRGHEAIIAALQHGLRLLTTDAHYRHIVHVIVDHIDPG